MGDIQFVEDMEDMEFVVDMDTDTEDTEDMVLSSRALESS